MNIQEAIKSGKPFREVGEYTSDAGWKFVDEDGHIRSVMTGRAIYFHVDYVNLETDWEVKP